MKPASALSVTGLSKAFGETPVLAGLDLEVPAGSLTAVLGPSGCGKTTLLRLIAGFEHADAGSIRLGGRVVCDERTHTPPRAAEWASSPRRARSSRTRRSRQRRLRPAPRAASLGPSAGAARAGRARRAGQAPPARALRRPAAARRARAGARPAPGLVLLDEPFDALDAGLRAQVRAEVREVLRESGATALLVTHDQEEALSLADVVAVMRDGTIVQAADPQTLYRDPVDAELAGFLGEAVLLAGELHAEHADTALGRLRLAPAPTAIARRRTGSTVMLRPEQILCREPLAGAPRGRVLATQFYGHDATARIALDDPSPRGHRTRCRPRAAAGRRACLGRRRGNSARLSIQINK